MQKYFNPTELRKYLGGISRATLWRYQTNKDGKFPNFPKPKRISRSILLWEVEAVEKWLNEKGGENGENGR